MLRTYFIICFCFVLTSCAQQGGGRQASPFEDYVPGTMPVATSGTQTVMVDGHMQQNTQTMAPTQSTFTGKVALLLPLSGAQAAVGQSMLNAAQMALFDMRESGFELMPFDTQGTRTGTVNAVQQAANQQAKIILGPLLADNVQAAGQAARRHRLQVIGFTTDQTKVGGNTMTLGILPGGQGKRIAQHAGTAGLNRIAIITSNDAYARSVITAFELEAAQQGIQIVDRQALRTDADASRIAQILSGQRDTFDAIFMPIGNPRLSLMARALAENSLGTNVTTWLGAGLWDDPAIRANPLMRNALYAAPSTQQRLNFESNYQGLYDQNPHRLASLAYDATALSIILLRQNNRFIDRRAVMNPNGFSGIDGIFRFLPNGMAERGLAVHRISDSGRTAIIDQAPNNFISAGLNHR